MTPDLKIKRMTFHSQADAYEAAIALGYSVIRRGPDAVLLKTALDGRRAASNERNTVETSIVFGLTGDATIEHENDFGGTSVSRLERK